MCFTTQPAEDRVLGKGRGYPVVERGGFAVKTFDNAAEAQKEFSLLNDLHHDHIVRVYGMATLVCGKIEMSMALGGVELFDVVAAKGGVPDDAEALFRQVVCGERHMHERCVAHMDLKLENCVLGSDGVVRIIDMGLACRLPPALAGTRCATRAMGTQTYCAPEVWTRAYDPFLNDVWALGILAYILHHGRPLHMWAHRTDNNFRYLSLAQSVTVVPSTAIDSLHWEQAQAPVPKLPDWLRATVDETLWINPERRRRLV